VVSGHCPHLPELGSGQSERRPARPGGARRIRQRGSGRTTVRSMRTVTAARGMGSRASRQRADRADRSAADGTWPPPSRAGHTRSAGRGRLPPGLSVIAVPLPRNRPVRRCGRGSARSFSAGRVTVRWTGAILSERRTPTASGRAGQSPLTHCQAVAWPHVVRRPSPLSGDDSGYPVVASPVWTAFGRDGPSPGHQRASCRPRLIAQGHRFGAGGRSPSGPAGGADRQGRHSRCRRCEKCRWCGAPRS
jgi:hypothetical protein